MPRVVITGTGLYQPPQVITNAELVEAFNAYAQRFNTRNAARIEAGVEQCARRAPRVAARGEGEHDLPARTDIDCAADLPTLPGDVHMANVAGRHAEPSAPHVLLCRAGCPKCGGEMKGIAWITDRAVIDPILAHRAKAGLASPFEARAGPSDRQGQGPIERAHPGAGTAPRRPDDTGSGGGSGRRGRGGERWGAARAATGVNWESGAITNAKAGRYLNVQWPSSMR